VVAVSATCPFDQTVGSSHQLLLLPRGQLPLQDMLAPAAGSLQGFLYLGDHTRALGPVEPQSGFADSLLVGSLPHVVAEKIHCSHLRLVVAHLTLNLRQLQIRRPALHRPVSSFRQGPMQLEELGQ
jgi:hypothetical protein